MDDCLICGDPKDENGLCPCDDPNSSWSPEKFTVGPLTMNLVFEASGITDLHDLQPVLDQIEKVLVGLCFGGNTKNPE
jgi:hypothetical protein